MRLNKRELSEKLDVSETSLTTWQKQGMPVLEHGARGKPGVYDLCAVVRWIRDTGAGLLCRTGPRIDLDRLERECGPVPPAVLTFPDPRTIHAIELATGDSMVEAAAWMVHLFNLQPATAIHCAEIFIHEQCSAFEGMHGFSTGPCHVAGDNRVLLEDDGLQQIVAKVEARACELLPGALGVYEAFFASGVQTVPPGNDA